MLAFVGRSNAQLPAQPHLKVELISEQPTSPPGQPLWVGLLFRLEPGWHIYWQNPGDSGEPSRTQWNLPTGFLAGSIRWPQPIRLGGGSVVDYGYEGQVLLMAPLQASSSRKETSLPSLSADVKYIVCRDVCIPRESSYYVVSSNGRRLGCLARAIRANTGTAFEAIACRLESNRSIGQTAFRIVGAGEVATGKRELFPARAEPDRQFRRAGVYTDSQWISPNTEEVGPVNKADYQLERPYRPRARPRLRGFGSRRFAVGVSNRVNLEETIDDDWG